MTRLWATPSAFAPTQPGRTTETGQINEHRGLPFLQRCEHPATRTERLVGAGLDRHLNELTSRIVDTENIDVSEADKQLAHARSIGFHRGSPSSDRLNTFRLAGPLYRARGPSHRPDPAQFRCARIAR